MGVHYSALPPTENLAAFLLPANGGVGHSSPLWGLLQGVFFALGLPNGLAETSSLMPHWLSLFLPSPTSFRFSFLGCQTQTVDRRFSPDPSRGVTHYKYLARLIPTSIRFAWDLNWHRVQLGF